jgi:hypothetical protein
MGRIAGIFVLLALAGCGGPDAVSEQERLEAEFRETMSGAVLVGKFSAGNREDLSEERYTISSVKKVAGDLWLINSRIQYGSRDVTVPVPVKVLWAGDTPVITLTDVAIPKVGTFTARVLIYRGAYAGTWSGGDHGGQMFGRIERAE